MNTEKNNILSNKELIKLIDNNFYDSARKSAAKISSGKAKYVVSEPKETDNQTSSTLQE